MQIITAKSAGFCFGVARAVKLAEQAALQNENVKTLGPLIHNESVENHLKSLGVIRVDNISELKAGDTVIIRSHGTTIEENQRLRELGVKVIDATCPDVASIHEIVSRESEEGRLIVIIGDACHPEICAIRSRCNKAVVFSSPEETDYYVRENIWLAGEPVSVVSQTTLPRSIFEDCVENLKKVCTNLRVFDTICFTTSGRQTEAEKLAEKCGAMLVIGDKTSANSRRLYEICNSVCPRVQFIETASDIDTKYFSDVSVIGITAGASTPSWIIKEVNQKMIDENNMAVQAAETSEPEVLEVASTADIVETVIAETETAPAPAEPAPEEPAPEENTQVEAAPEKKPDEEKEETFDELLEKSIKTLYTGEKVKGIVSAVTPTEISVDLGTKQSGYIPVSELTDDPPADLNDIIKIGDEIETFVLRVNDVEGTVMLSKKRLDSVKAWEDISEAKGSKAVVEGIVVEDNKGGIVVSIKGIRVFVPASQSGLPRDASMAELLKQKVRLRITEVNQQRRRVVGSIRAVQFDERREKAQEIWNEIEVGKHYMGAVKSLTSYGAFVDIGGIDGMVHVSEISWSRIRQPSDVLSVGDNIDVYVLSFDKEKRKISLGHKDKDKNPWTFFTNQYKIGDTANVKIVKLMPFGAFAEVTPGVDGLIHISQLADRRVDKCDEVVSVGQEVDVKIVDIDYDKQKVSLSIRALLQPAPVFRKAPDTQETDFVVYDTDRPPVQENEE